MSTTTTDQEIAQAIHSLFTETTNPNDVTRTNNLNSLNGVVQELESKLGRDLSHKLDFIRAQIHRHFFFQQQPSPPAPPPRQHQHQHPRISTHNDHFALHQSLNLLPASSAFQSFSAQPSAPVKDEADSVSAAAAGKSNEPPKESGQTKPKRRGGAGGLNKLCGVSPELEVIVGQPTLPRTEIVKQLWAYIRKNNLQDPSNKRKIICNDELRLVFETDCTDMFKMNKLLAKHIISLEPTKQSSTKKQKVDGESGMRSFEVGPSVIISEGLANFFGVGGREMLQSEVLRRIWEYIKVHNLEDTTNPMVILCDAKLQDIFGCQSISALGIPELLSPHILRR
ncbi:hypothetical protein Ddye_027660 [Dipteronia dyeriana]|uniref:DM2 domain-containing protein n=1 Tax=Dipteronia dyeriana TaxID=168575 RepID=A0AAD9TQG6_9ROSI|nr:hypothetical protein Ddye_027660 [Dipteronia dyeriana]